MNPVIGSVLRNVGLMLGTYLVTHLKLDQATVMNGIDAIITIGGALIAGGSAVWSLVRAIGHAKQGIK